MFERVLVANDGSSGGYQALDAAIAIAKKFKAELHMIIVEEFPLYGDIEATAIVLTDLHERCAKVMIESAKIAKKKRIKLHPHLIEGFTVRTITDFAKEYNFDLLVVGFMEHSAFYRWFVGSTTDGLVDHVPCAVLVVK
jgi:nucleotide-binding universal stress UspA family protein